MPADERNRVRVASRYTRPAFSAVIDGVHKHTPCPLMTTTGAQRKPGVQARLAAESPKDSRRSHLNPGFKVVWHASTWWRDRKSTRLTPVTNAQLVCRLML